MKKGTSNVFVFRLLIILLLSFLVDLIFFAIGKAYSWSYLFVAIFKQILCFCGGIYFLDEKNAGRLRYREHIIIFFAALFVFIFHVLTYSFAKSENSGIIYAGVLGIIIAALCLFGLFFIARLNKNDNSCFELVLHLTGLTSVCIYFIDESGLFYDSSLECLSGLKKGGVIYIITIVSCVIYGKLRKPDLGFEEKVLH